MYLWLNPPVFNVEFQSHDDEDGLVGSREINVEKDLWGIGSWEGVKGVKKEYI